MINHIYQDSKGYIWVSTEDGLNKYDGAKFVNYKNHFNDSTSLLGNHVYRTFVRTFNQRTSDLQL